MSPSEPRTLEQGTKSTNAQVGLRRLRLIQECTLPRKKVNKNKENWPFISTFSVVATKGHRIGKASLLSTHTYFKVSRPPTKEGVILVKILVMCVILGWSLHLKKDFWLWSLLQFQWKAVLYTPANYRCTVLEGREHRLYSSFSSFILITRMSFKMS